MPFVLRPKMLGESKESLGEYPQLLKELLFNRGITLKKEADLFLNPDYERGIHDPFLLKDMDQAVERILRAIEKKEKVAIWSDYDADGVPGAVALHDFFKKIGFLNFINHIPDRHFDGFGLHKDALIDLAKNGVSLLITIDCGIGNVEEVKLGSELGMDIIITDHHVPGALLPSAYAIINPKKNGCSYPEKMLCGSGVVFKLIQAILQKNRFGLKAGEEKWFLDMIGIATLSDMVPLVGENRILAFYGLKVLKKSRRPGLLKLLSSLKVNQKEATADDVGFMLTPRINAASRLGVSKDAFKLFATENEEEAEELVQKLNALNDERKGIVSSMVKEAKMKLKERVSGNDFKIIVLGNPSWRPSLLGLVANTLVDEYHTPVFLWGRDGGDHLKGSCRSKDISLMRLMENVKEGIFAAFGGHHLSGGFELSKEGVHTFSEELEKALLKINTDEAPSPTLLDGNLSLHDVNYETWRMIEKLEPFGVGNPKPVFLFENIEIERIEKFGKEKNHLKLIFRKNHFDKVNAIAFFESGESYQTELLPGKKINLVANIERSLFRNFPELRLRIVDIF